MAVNSPYTTPQENPHYMRYNMCIQYILLNHLMDCILTSMGTSVNVCNNCTTIVQIQVDIILSLNTATYLLYKVQDFPVIP